MRAALGHLARESRAAGRRLCEPLARAEGAGPGDPGPRSRADPAGRDQRGPHPTSRHRDGRSGPEEGVGRAGGDRARGGKVHPQDGPAGMARSRPDRRERQRPAEAGRQQPGADRYVDQAARDDPAPLRYSRAPAQGAVGPARRDTEPDERREMSSARRFPPLMALLLLLAPAPGSAGPPVSPEEDAAFRREGERLRANQEKALAGIRGPEGGADAAARREKPTRDRIAAASRALTGGCKV